MVFLVSIFLVLNAIFILFFVFEYTPVVIWPMNLETYQILVDELKLDESLAEQYGNFMVRMLSGDFFTSISAERFTDISDFIYGDALLTAAHLIVVIVLSIAAGGVYAYLASRWRPRCVGKAMFALAMIAAMTSAWLFFLCIIWMLSRWDESILSEGFNLRVISCAFFPIAGASVLVLEKTVRSVSADDVIAPARRIWRAMFDPFLTGVMPFLIAYAMTVVLIAEMTLGHSGLGYTILRAFLYVDWPLTMVCAYVVSLVLLMMYLIMDMAIIYAGTRVRGHRGLAGPYGVRSSDHAMSEPATLPSLSQFWSAYRKSKIGIIALIGLVTLLGVGLASPLLATVQDPYSLDSQEPFSGWGLDTWSNPHPPTLSPSPVMGFIHPLGTDHMGRDVYSMILYDILDSLWIAFIVAVIALAAGMITEIFRGVLSLNGGSFAKPGGWLAWAAADMAIAMPAFLILSICRRIEFFVILLPLVLFAWAWGPFGRTAAARLVMFDEKSGDQGARRVLDVRSVAGVLRIGKLGFLFVYLSFALTVGLFLYHVSWMDFGWADSIWSAWEYGAFYRHFWWLVVPQVVMIGVVVGLVYVVIDHVERVLRSWKS